MVRPSIAHSRHWGSSASPCLLIEFQIGDLYQEAHASSTWRVVAGPITFQLGAEAVLGHGIALHSFAYLVAARSLAKPVRASQMRMDIEVSRGAGCENHTNSGEAEQASGTEIAD